MPTSFTIGNVPSGPSASRADATFGLKEGYLIEVVDTREPAHVIEAFAFPIAPLRYNLSEPFAAVLTPTEGNSVVTEEYGHIIRNAVIEGTFGLSKKRVQGFLGVQGGGQPLSGNAHFAALRGLFRRYAASKQDPTLNPVIQMRWHCLRDDDHFIVIPKNFETPRDAKSSRVTYQYRITLDVIGLVDDILVRTISDDTGDFFTNGLRSIANAFNDARAAFADITANVSAVQRKLANIQAVLINASAFVDAVGNALRASTGIIEYPFKLAAQASEQLETASDDLADAITDSTSGVAGQFVRDLRRLQQATNRVLAFPERFRPPQHQRLNDVYSGERRLSARDIADGTAGATPGTVTRVAFGSEGESGITLPETVAVISVPVDRTTTLLTLAGRYSVPPEVIALLNNLTAPYFTPEGGPGTLGVGDRVLIPTPVARGSNAAIVAPMTDYATPDELLYGRDFAIDLDVFKAEGVFDIQVDEAHGALDAELIGGIPNVVQGTLITVETEKGSTAYIPDLGINRTAGIKGTLNNLLLASLNLRAALLSDPRIADIQSESVVLDGDVLSQEITPVLVGSRNDVTLVRPFGRVSAGT